MRLFTLMLIILVLAAYAHAAPMGKDIRFGPNSQYYGYLTRPSGNGPFPALVVIHEWWGLNDYIKDQSDNLARQGYVCLAVDLFGQYTTDTNQAMKMVQSLNQQNATAQELAAANYLRNQSFVKPSRVGAIGWCFGGAQTLNLAINDPKLKVAVIYYGPPVTDPIILSRIRARLLCLYGEADQSIPIAKVHEFQNELKRAKVKFDLITYPDAPHAFANPSRGPNYRPEAAKDAWLRTIKFLKKYL